jgi:hypothetical protein
MKKLLFILAALFALIAVSCSKEEDALTLTSTTFAISNSGATQALSFNANSNWSIKSDQDWVTFDKESGTSGDVVIEMTIAPNTTYEERTAKVTLQSGDKTSIFTVNQSEVNEFGSSSVCTIDAKAQDIAVDVKANLEYSVTVADDAKDWITITQTKSEPVAGKAILHVSANAGIGPRTGHFTISTDEYSQTYEIIQNAEFTKASEASAVYLKNVQKIYDSENWEYTNFKQFAVTLKTDDGDEVMLALNDTAALSSTSEVVTGTFEVDAAADHSDKTFSIKSTDGHEKYYTTVISGGKEISIVDGEINVTYEDGTYTITAVLVDAAETEHRYSYQGAITVTDESFGANVMAPEFHGTYNTYYTTKTNEWSVGLYISDAANSSSPYVSYISFNVFGPKGDISGDDLPTGTFTYNYPSDISSSYATGIQNAPANTFYIYSGSDIDGNSISATKGKGGTLTISKNSDGTYNFVYSGSLSQTINTYDDNYNLIGSSTTIFDYSGTFNNVYVPAVLQGQKPYPDTDYEFNTIMSSSYPCMWFGDPFSTGDNLFVFSLSNINSNYTLQLALNVSGEWTFTKNFINKYCSTPFKTGNFTFSGTAASDVILPIKYYGKDYCYIVNGYTGTKYLISGGSVTLTDKTITCDLQATANGKTYNFTGSTPAIFYFAIDYSTKIANVTL